MLILLVSTAGSLLLAETAVRRFYHDEIDTGALRKKETTLMEMGGVAQPAQRPELLFELKRGLNQPWMQAFMRTSDEYPGRISTFAPTIGDFAVRIALVGDSTSFGYGVHAEIAYPEILRTGLEKFFGKPVELRNFSVPGYNSTQQRVIVEAEVLPWKPDLFILHYDHNDPDPVYLHDLTDPGKDVYTPYTRLPPEYGDNFLNSSLVKFVKRRLRVVRRKAAFRVLQTRDKELCEYQGEYRCAGPRYDGHLEEIRRMGRLATQLGIPAVALVYDSKVTRFESPGEDPHYLALHPAIVKTLQDAGFLVLDLYPRLQEIMRDKDWQDLQPIWRQVPQGTDQDHPNEQGHFLIADSLYKFLLAAPVLREIFNAAKEPAQPEDFRRRLAATTNYQEALFLASQGRHAEAEPLLREALAYNPGDIGVRQSLIRALISQEKNKEAIGELEQLVALRAELRVERFQLATLLARSRRFADAIPHYRAAIDLPTTHGNNQLSAKDIAEDLAKSYLGLAGEEAARDRGNAVDSMEKALNHYRYLGDEAMVGEAEKKLRTLRSAPGAPSSETAPSPLPGNHPRE